VIPLVQEIVGEKVRVIDPAPAVAKQVKRLLEAGGMKSPLSARGEVKFYTSGEPAAFKSILMRLLGEDGVAEKVSWLSDTRLK
jgi:glutamate racemase